MIHGSEQRTSVDFNQIPFIQSVYECLPQHPTEGSGDSGPIQVGRFYFNTTDNTLYVYTTLGWKGFTFNSKKIFVIGDGVATTFTCHHNLGTRDLCTNVRLTAAPYSLVDIDVDMTDPNYITVSSAIPLLVNELTVVVQ